MSKVLILDIDGPMIPVRAFFLPNQTRPASMFDPCATGMLLKLLQESGAKIVISSTWGRFGKARCEELLAKNGIDPAHLHEDWVTPRKMSSARYHEIQWWLDAHPEVTHYVAVDDEDLPVDWITTAVLCDGQEGFSFRNYLECKVMLGIPETSPQGDLDRINYCKRREVWRLGRQGEPIKHTLLGIADDLFPVDQ